MVAASLHRFVTAKLSRVFLSAGHRLAARKGLAFRSFLVQELFAHGGPVGTDGRTPVREICELFVDEAFKRAAAGGDGSAAAIRAVCLPALQKSFERAAAGDGGSDAALGEVYELVVRKTLDRAAAAGGGSAAAVRDACEFVVREGVARTGGYTGRAGTNNEGNRAQWVEATLKELPAGLRLLDAGAGEQQYRKHCAHLDYVSQDFAQYDGAGNQAGLQTGAWNYGEIDIVSDICSIPQPDASFDAVLCTEVFEHIPDPIGALREFARLLRPGGTLIVTAPFASLTHFAPHFYYTGFSRFFFSSVLAEHGFDDVRIAESGGYFDYLSQELHRLPSVADRYATEALGAELKRDAWLLQETLARCAAHDTRSRELLCYGLHVVARRA